MAAWQARPAHDPRLNAMDYRNGLMMALLALCPLRLENLAAIVIGQHFTLDLERPRLVFTAEEMKGKRPLEFDVPAVLQARLAFYLSDIHPLLYRGLQRGAPLWPSLHTGKPQMSEHGIYTRITQVTEKHLGYPVTPHMFRDAAATFITELAPEHAMMAAAILQHASLDVTMRHYVHGEQHLAARKYHAAIDEMIARVAAEPIDLQEKRPCEPSSTPASAPTCKARQALTTRFGSAASRSSGMGGMSWSTSTRIAPCREPRSCARESSRSCRTQPAATLILSMPRRSIVSAETRRTLPGCSNACASGELREGLDRQGAARDRAICSNHLTIHIEEIEASILAGLKERLMEPALFEEFAREFAAEVNRQRSALASERETLQRELARVTKQIDKLVDAIIEGADALALNAKLKELEAQKAALANRLAGTPEAEPLLHPALATIYRDTVEKLEASLCQPDTGREAFELVRGLINAIILIPVEGRLEIELRGDLAGILALSEASKAGAFSAKEKALQIKMVAGARSHLYRTRLHYIREGRK